jgi:hypothetical protein
MGSLRRIALIAGLATAASAPVAHAMPMPAEPADPAATPAAGKYEQLSDENKLSRVAHANWDYKIRAKPSNSARSIAKLHFNTEDGRAEIYIALRQFTTAKGAVWVEIRVPGRPNGRKGWVPREGLGEFKVLRTHLVINRKTLRITLFKNAKKIFQAPVGVGKSSTPTPGGNFWIREILHSFHNAVYGPLAFGTAAYSTKLKDWPGGGVVGIHGTNEPNLIPGRPSHGCVRMKNASILRLKRLLPLGTPLTIL